MELRAMYEEPRAAGGADDADPDPTEEVVNQAYGGVEPARLHYFPQDVPETEGARLYQGDKPITLKKLFLDGGANANIITQRMCRDNNLEWLESSVPFNVTTGAARAMGLLKTPFQFVLCKGTPLERCKVNVM